jgi:hypothetical protein
MGTIVVRNRGAGHVRNSGLPDFERLLGSRQANADGSALARFALDFERSLMALDDAEDHRQAQTSADIALGRKERQGLCGDGLRELRTSEPALIGPQPDLRKGCSTPSGSRTVNTLP